MLCPVAKKTHYYSTGVTVSVQQFAPVAHTSIFMSLQSRKRYQYKVSEYFIKNTQVYTIHAAHMHHTIYRQHL